MSVSLRVWPNTDGHRSPLTCVAHSTVRAVPICAAKPRVKVSLAIFSPIAGEIARWASSRMSLTSTSSRSAASGSPRDAPGVLRRVQLGEEVKQKMRRLYRGLRRIDRGCRYRKGQLALQSWSVQSSSLAL
mgnify:CR=1 FL=1